MLRVAVLQQCWTLYNEFLKCSKKIGLANDKCKQIFKCSAQLSTAQHSPALVADAVALRLLLSASVGANAVCPSDLVQSYYESRRDDKWSDLPRSALSVQRSSFPVARALLTVPSLSLHPLTMCRYGFDYPLQEEELKEGDEITHREKPGHGHGDDHH